MPLDLSQLESELGRDESVTSSAETLITSLLDEVAANSGNQAAVNAIVERYRAATDRLAAAVAKGTPGETPA
jgi:hypothetical protein